MFPLDFQQQLHLIFVELKGKININDTAVNAVGAYVGDTSTALNPGKVNGTNEATRNYLRSGDVKAESTLLLQLKVQLIMDLLLITLLIILIFLVHWTICNKVQINQNMVEV